MSIKLSGKRRHILRKYWFRKPVFVLQVEEVGTVPDFHAGQIEMADVKRWRDAKLEDMSIHE